MAAHTAVSRWICAAKSAGVLPTGIKPCASSLSRTEGCASAAPSLEFARALAVAGARVAIADVLADQAQQAAAQLRADGHEVHAFALDLAAPASVKACASAAEAALGGLDDLVNNGAITNSGGRDLHQLETDTWDQAMTVNRWRANWGRRHHRQRRGAGVDDGRGHRLRARSAPAPVPRAAPSAARLTAGGRERCSGLCVVAAGTLRHRPATGGERRLRDALTLPGAPPPGLSAGAWLAATGPHGAVCRRHAARWRDRAGRGSPTGSGRSSA